MADEAGGCISFSHPSCVNSEVPVRDDEMIMGVSTAAILDACISRFRYTHAVTLCKMHAHIYEKQVGSSLAIAKSSSSLNIMCAAIHTFQSIMTR